MYDEAEALSLHIESDLIPRLERLESHLHVLRGSQRHQIAVLVLVLDAQRTIVPPRPAQPDLLAHSLDKLVVLRRARHLDDEDVFVKVHLDLDRR